MTARSRWYLDRVEDGTAVLVHEDGRIAYVPANLLPPDTRPGHWLELEVRSAPPPDRPDLRRLA